MTPSSGSLRRRCSRLRTNRSIFRPARYWLAPAVWGVVTTFSLVPADTHRGRAVVNDLLEARGAGDPIEDVVWDPGYSLCKPGTVHHKLTQAGIHQTFQPPSNSICKSIRYLDKDCINKFTTEKRRTDVLVNDADIISIDF